MSRSLVVLLAACGALALAGAKGCASADQADAARARRADFHALCPLNVAHPAVVPVFDARRWSELLAGARTVPPPYNKDATDFRRDMIVVVALANTPTPMTKAALDSEHPARFDEASGLLSLRLAVQTTPLAAGRVGATVVGEPCLIAWLPVRSGVREVVASTTGDETIARWKAPGR